MRIVPGDSKAWRLDLARPTAKSAEPRPAIVFIHGGGWRGGDKRRGTFLNGALDYAAKGYVCVTLNYRLLAEAPFPACIEDCKCAVRWLRANAQKYNIDPDRIGGYGNSAGCTSRCDARTCWKGCRTRRRRPLSGSVESVTSGLLLGHSDSLSRLESALRAEKVRRNRRSSRNASLH